MAGPSEAADDLIAELAKLMARDADDDRKATPPASAASPLVSVRIPGEPAQKPAAGGPAAFLRSLSSVDPAKPEPDHQADPIRPTPVHLSQERRSEPQFQAVPEQKPQPEQDQLDFGHPGDSGPESTLQMAQAASPVPQPAAVPAEPDSEPAGYDSIADLISAELASTAAPLPNPTPAPRAPDLAAAPSAGPALMATTVAATAAQGEALGSVRADHDRFKVPPVFGLGSAAPTGPAAAVPPGNGPVEPSVAPPPPRSPASAEQVASRPSATPAATPAAPPPASPVNAGADVDPIDEIENLIGRAMRVEFDLPSDETAVVAAKAAPEAPAPRPAPSPALRSLATPTMATQKAEALSAADQTIFAAAEASGAEIGWVNSPPVADPVAEAHQAAPRQRRHFRPGISRALAGPLVAVTLLLAAGFGLYWVLGLGGREAGPAPLLAADTAPVKEAAPVASADDSAAPQSVVFNEINGGTAGADEQLISRDQTDVNEVTQVAASTTDVSEEGLANRKVRTVKVRPDGTIVSGDDSVAGSTILPVDRPNVPAVPGAETTIPELLANAEADAVEPTPEPAAATTVPVQPGSTVQAVDLAGNPIAGKTAVVPLTRPAGLRLAAAAPTTAEVPAATTTSTTPAAATPSVSVPGAVEVPALADTAPAYVQLASQRSEADARQSAQNMVTRYGPLFGGANLEVQRVDLGAKGIYYRVRVPASSLEQANVICANVKAAGGDCFTL